MTIEAWLVAAAFWSACLIAVQVGLRFAIKYDLSQHELRVVLFRVVTLHPEEFARRLEQRSDRELLTQE